MANDVFSPGPEYDDLAKPQPSSGTPVTKEKFNPGSEYDALSMGPSKSDEPELETFSDPRWTAKKAAWNYIKGMPGVIADTAHGVGTLAKGVVDLNYDVGRRLITDPKKAIHDAYEGAKGLGNSVVDFVDSKDKKNAAWDSVKEWAEPFGTEKYWANKTLYHGADLAADIGMGAGALAMALPTYGASLGAGTALSAARAARYAAKAASYLDPVQAALGVAGKTAKGAAYLAPKLQSAGTGLPEFALKSATEYGRSSDSAVKSAYKTGISGAVDPVKLQRETVRAIEEISARDSAAWARENSALAAQYNGALDYSKIDTALAAQARRLHINDSFHPAHRAEEAVMWEEIKDLVEAWKTDPTKQNMKGFHELKTSIGAKKNWNAPGQTSHVIDPMYNAVKETLIEKAPDYAALMDHWQDHLAKVKNLDISTGSKSSANAALLKTMRLMKTPEGASLLKSLDGVDKTLVPKIVGSSLRPLVSGGNQRLFEALMAYPLYSLVNPAAAVLPFVAGSPRLNAAVNYGVGSASRAASAVANSLPGKAAGAFLSQPARGVARMADTTESSTKTDNQTPIAARSRSESPNQQSMTDALNIAMQTPEGRAKYSGPALDTPEAGRGYNAGPTTEPTVARAPSAPARPAQRDGIVPASFQRQPAAPSGDIFSKLIQAESSNRQLDRKGATITSPKGALGIAQVMPRTGPEAARLAGEEWSLDRLMYDRDYNMKLGQAYFDKQMQDFGDVAAALAAYNAGPGATRTALNEAKRTGRHFLSFLKPETQNYVAKILRGPPMAARGGRIERATGGKVGSVDHVKEAANLIAAAERAKRAHGEDTKPLLEEHDDTIVHALKVANDAI